MSLRTHTSHPSTDRELLSEQELIAMYMREVGPSPHGIFATTQVSDTLVDALNCSETDELRRGLNLIEYMSHEGLELEYDPFSFPLSQTHSQVQIQAQVRHSGTNSKTEIPDVASIETGGRFRDCLSDSDSDPELDFDETGSLMECGDAIMPTKCNINENMPSPGGSAAKFNLYKLLDAIQARHLAISCGFQAAHTRLESLREQNKRDSLFLRKLSISNERMGDQIHEMKNEVSSIFRELEQLKKPMAVEQEKTHNKVYPCKFPIMVPNTISDSFEKEEGLARSEQKNSFSQQVIRLQTTKSDTEKLSCDINANSETGPSHINLGVTKTQGPLLNHTTSGPAAVALVVLLLACWVTISWTSIKMDGK